MTCDRCHHVARLGKTVRMFTECQTCGPVPLCYDCTVRHRNEIKDGEL